MANFDLKKLNWINESNQVFPPRSVVYSQHVLTNANAHTDIITIVRKYPYPQKAPSYPLTPIFHHPLFVNTHFQRPPFLCHLLRQQGTQQQHLQLPAPSNLTSSKIHQQQPSYVPNKNVLHHQLHLQMQRQESYNKFCTRKEVLRRKTQEEQQQQQFDLRQQLLDQEVDSILRYNESTISQDRFLSDSQLPESTALKSLPSFDSPANLTNIHKEASKDVQRPSSIFPPSTSEEQERRNSNTLSQANPTTTTPRLASRRATKRPLHSKNKKAKLFSLRKEGEDQQQQQQQLTQPPPSASNSEENSDCLLHIADIPHSCNNQQQQQQNPLQQQQQSEGSLNDSPSSSNLEVDLDRDFKDLFPDLFY
jgi:hypothetical protein